MNKKGFTLIEILLVVALLAILAGIIIIAINPSKQLSETRNAQRRVDVKTIVDAIYQYSIDNNGTIPTVIPTASSCPGSGVSEVCKEDGVCASFVDLSVLTTNSKYLPSIPYDPKDSTSNGTGYNVVKTSDNRVIVCAPHAENSVSISIER